MPTQEPLSPQPQEGITPPDPAPAAAPVPDPAAPPSPDQRLLDLSAREAALEARERQFHAREHVLALGLDPAILAHFDYSSDAALQNSLQVAALASRAATGMPLAAIPAAARPPAPSFATYLERARLFREDLAAYALMVEEQRKP